MYTCPLGALLQAPIKSSQTSLIDKASVWRQVADLPVRHSTCESFHGQLMAIGGRMDSGKLSTAVYMYDSTTNSWDIISHMTIAIGQCACFTAVLPDDQLMVMGGLTDCGLTDIVEIASVCN